MWQLATHLLINLSISVVMMSRELGCVYIWTQQPSMNTNMSIYSGYSNLAMTERGRRHMLVFMRTSMPYDNCVVTLWTPGRVVFLTDPFQLAQGNG